MAKALGFAFDDAGTFDDNVNAFSVRLDQLDEVLGSPLKSALTALADEIQDRPQLLTDLLAALAAPAVEGEAEPNVVPAAVALTPPGAAAPAIAAPSPPRWFLKQVEIEGLRGINNEGSPLSLTFKSDCVNSVSAPNGVGKARSMTR